MSKDIFFDKYEKANVIQRGHFKLSSGLHSDTYFQMSRVFEDPILSEVSTKYFIYKNNLAEKNIDIIIGLAMGSILFSYELARALGNKTKSIYCERVNGQFQFRRGFDIPYNANVYLVEDVLTTGKSLKEAIELVELFQCNIVGYGSLILRASKLDDFLLKADTLLNIVSNDCLEKNCDQCKSNIKINAPGSRYIK